MTRRDFTSSALAHAGVLGLFLLLAHLFRGPSLLLIEGFDYMGSGGGGGTGGGLKQERVGQPVPQPVKVPLQPKPAPVKEAVRAEDKWKVNKTVKTEVKETKPVNEAVVTGEKEQKEQSNIIRIGTDPNEKTADGKFDFGTPGTGDGGQGKGVGIGFGPGTGGGFGFGSYLSVMRRRIFEEWNQAQVFGANFVCVVGLTVYKSGDVDDIALEKASGNSFYDNVALRAVRNASPLPPLPSGVDKQRFRIQFKLLD